MLAQALQLTALSLALLGGDSPSTISQTWKEVELVPLRPVAENEPAREKRVAYELRVSETEVCKVSLLDGKTGIDIHVQVTEVCDGVSVSYDCHIRMMMARLLKQKKDVVIIFYDTQPKKNSPALPLTLFDYFRKYVDQCPNEDIRWFLSHYPEKLEAPSVLVDMKPREHAKSDLRK